jgi:hypothetical protein
VLRDVGGFDLDAAHFDDWSAWIRLADRKVRMCSVGDIVAEWRLHGEGLSAGITNTRVMKARLLALFDHLKNQLSAEGAGAIATARHLVANSEIHTYDFADGTPAAGWKLAESTIATTGVIIATYEPAGEIQEGLVRGLMVQPHGIHTRASVRKWHESHPATHECDPLTYESHPRMGFICSRMG